MPIYQVEEIELQRREHQQAYREFLRVPALSAGLYAIPAGPGDQQRPHREDEVYVVLRGQGLLEIDGQDHVMQPGVVAFVPAAVPHHFHSVTAELSLLVFFGPAESQ